MPDAHRQASGGVCTESDEMVASCDAEGLLRLSTTEEEASLRMGHSGIVVVSGGTQLYVWHADPGGLSYMPWLHNNIVARPWHSLGDPYYYYCCYYFYR